MVRRTLVEGCCTTPSAMCYWAAAFVLLYGAGLMLASGWPLIRPFGDTLILVALGAACFVNFRRNRTLHCGFTAPLFALGAVAAGLAEAGIWAIDLSLVWGIVLVGVGVAFVVEWRTVGQNGGSDACNPPAR